jgi:hypothetical protein
VPFEQRPERHARIRLGSASVPGVMWRHSERSWLSGSRIITHTVSNSNTTIHIGTECRRTVFPRCGDDVHSSFGRPDDAGACKTLANKRIAPLTRAARFSDSRSSNRGFPSTAGSLNLPKSAALITFSGTGEQIFSGLYGKKVRVTILPGHSDGATSTRQL